MAACCCMGAALRLATESAPACVEARAHVCMRAPACVEAHAHACMRAQPSIHSEPQGALAECRLVTSITKDVRVHLIIIS
eukprot:5645-Chlamydomonas_euryale.AAC.1